MQITVTHNKLNATLTLHGRFTFEVHNDFREAFNKAIDAGSKGIFIDLHDVCYMDSAALGMLLVVRDRAKGHAITITLQHPSPIVKSILDIANFQKLFQII